MALVTLCIMFKAGRNEGKGTPVTTVPFIGHFILNAKVKVVLLNDLVSFFYSPPSDDSLLSQREARILTITVRPVMCW